MKNFVNKRVKLGGLNLTKGNRTTLKIGVKRTRNIWGDSIFSAINSGIITKESSLPPSTKTTKWLRLAKKRIRKTPLALAEISKPWFSRTSRNLPNSLFREFFALVFYFAVYLHIFRPRCLFPFRRGRTTSFSDLFFQKNKPSDIFGGLIVNAFLDFISVHCAS